MLRRRDGVRRALFHLSVYGDRVVLYFHQFEVDADGIVLVEECRDLLFKDCAPIHSIQIKHSQHPAGKVRLQPLCHLTQELRGYAFAEDIAGRI